MANKRPKPEEIVTKLRQVEVLSGQGMPRLDAIRQIGVTEQTFYRWKKKYGGMGTDQLKELKRLQKENERLRKAVSDLTLDKLIVRCQIIWANWRVALTESSGHLVSDYAACA
jgi:transposase-like protein